MSSNPQLGFSPEQNLRYTELCNTLFEREILRLSTRIADANTVTPSSGVSGGLSLASFSKSMASLPFYVRAAASQLLMFPSPLTLDTLNASWLAKASKHCPLPKVDDAKKTFEWYSRYGKVGLLVPVYRSQSGVEQIMLDTVDEVDIKSQRLHTNAGGWFAFAGWPQTPENQHMLLLRPQKSVYTAACCGHQWRQGQLQHPRVLTLREMLLSSYLNWQNFAKPHPATRRELPQLQG